jgi:3-phenylpropionate/trans-cinnamate dioxygenase ferredoxin reductase subunit
VGYVVLDDGTRLPADLVIVGIGLIPNTELAGAAGLDVANGIMVDGFLLTGDPDIYAIGDCANHINQFLDQRLRLESVPNATEQARAVAGSICGAPTAYSAVPWFWSDQYDLKLQMAGLSQGYDQMVVRGDMESEAFCVFYLRDGMLIGADAVNRPAEFMLAKKLIAQHARPTEGQLADEKTPLKLLAQPTTAV